MYAIGDIHGQSILLERLLRRIADDWSARPRVSTMLVILGDMIDRGPHSAAVVRFLYELQRGSNQLVALKGNHEALLVDVLNGDYDALCLWLDHGGRASLSSWGIDDSLANPDRMRELIAALEGAIPLDQRRWLSTLPTKLRLGDYLFAHAGIRPGIPIDRQDDADLLWIRAPFLDHPDRHEAMIIHGHSIEEDGPVTRPNRIGLDTGAYKTERLSAIGLEGADRWFLSS